MAKKYAELRAKMSPDVREEAQRLAQEMRATMPLYELRRAHRLSQQTLAQAMNTSQGEVSKIEHRADLCISTLRSYIEAMGGRLTITATFPTLGSYEIAQLSQIEEDEGMQTGSAVA
jgi:hypothetical protein